MEYPCINIQARFLMILKRINKAALSCIFIVPLSIKVGLKNINIANFIIKII